MRKKIFYPSVINKDEESLVTQEEYRDQLSDIYSTQEHNLPEYLISNLIGSIQHEIKNSVGRTFACYPNAARSAQAIKSLSELSVEEMKERYSENRQLGYIFPIAILYKGEPEKRKKLIKLICTVKGEKYIEEKEIGQVKITAKDIKLLEEKVLGININVKL